MSILRRTLVTAVIALQAAAGSIASESPVALGQLEGLLSEWRAGPVRYLLTSKEDKRFKRLESDEERLTFIEEFWARRDPSPETPENEARELLWRRVLEANSLFVETTKHGWRTDRGQIFIMLGPPDEREIDPFPKGGRGEIRWIYRSSPVTGTGPNRIIAFRADSSGEYRISTNPGDYDLIFNAVKRFDLAVNPTLELLTQRSPVPGLTEAQLKLDLGELERPPTEAELVSAMVTVEEQQGEVPFITELEFYRTGEGTTFVAINLGLQRSFLPVDSGDGGLLPVARLESVDPPGLVFDFVYRNPFVPAPDNARGPADGYLVFQAGQGVPPGAYRTFFGVFHRGRGEVAARRGEVDVPWFAEGVLSLSSLSLARTSEPASAEESSSPYKRPFVLGGRRIIPNLGKTYRDGDLFSLYFQVYQAHHDAAGLRQLDVEYRFFALTADGVQAVGDPILTGPLTQQVVGWSFPIQGWPAATFRLRVTVRDRLGGASATREIDFVIDG